MRSAAEQNDAEDLAALHRLQQLADGVSAVLMGAQAADALMALGMAQARFIHTTYRAPRSCARSPRWSASPGSGFASR